MNNIQSLLIACAIMIVVAFVTPAAADHLKPGDKLSTTGHCQSATKLTRLISGETVKGGCFKTSPLMCYFISYVGRVQASTGEWYRIGSCDTGVEIIYSAEKVGQGA